METNGPSKLDSSALPWVRAWENMRSIWPQLVYISIASIAIPQWLCYLALSQLSSSATSQITHESGKSFWDIINLAQNFASTGILCYLALTLVNVIGYLTVLAVAIQSAEGSVIKPWLGAARAARALFPGGLLTAILALGLGALAIQLIFAQPGLQFVFEILFIAIGVNLAAWPVLQLRNPKGSIRNLIQAISMNYSQESQIGKWNVLFILLTYEMSLVSIISLIGKATGFLGNLDLQMQIPRSIWLAFSSTFPFGMGTALIQLVWFVLSALALSIFGNFTAVLVNDLLALRSKNSSSINITV